MIYSDIELSRKLERTEARSNADFVETRGSLMPESGAMWIEVAGAYAMFDGVGSPLTQTFGLGVFEDITEGGLDEIERFYRERGSDIFHEVSPMVDQSHMALLSDRGYRPIELTNVMYRELRTADSRSGEVRTEVDSLATTPPRPGAPVDLRVRPIDKSEADLWADTAAAGWASEGEEIADFLRAIGQVSARTSGGHPFLAEIDGRPVAAGGFQMYDDVCILAGASTIPDARRQGAQNALLRARLQFAVEHGCSFAMMCALPGSQSQKNAQKNGFKIAYTRTKWHLPL